jgi:hypothetical protein
MQTHPTVVHAVADLLRHALLSQAADDWRTTLTRGLTKGMRSGKACRCTIAWVTRSVSRILDDFEPGPGPRPRPLSRGTG